jgi:hypothetical protein
MLSGKAPQLSEMRSNRQIVSTRANWATPHGGNRRRIIVRFGGAQGTRDTGGFFGFGFFPGKENEQT